MTVQAAIPLGIDVTILADAPDSPAGRLTRSEIVGGWDDQAALEAFARVSEVVTLENEFVPAEVLEQLSARGALVRPGAAGLRTIQDKLRQKQALQAQGLPVPRFAAVESAEDILRAADEFGWPLILKARRNGYDGYGNATIRSADEIGAAWERLTTRARSTSGVLLVEQAVPFVRELAVLVARDPIGRSVTYPVVETIQRDHICHIVRAPAAIEPTTARLAAEIAQAAVAAVAGVGITAVELFELVDGAVLVNELAPRPHNSGHFSIDACLTSQFENHVRAVLGLPLGDPSLRSPAVMVNLLGARDGDCTPRGLEQALAIPNAHVHLYGKRAVRRGRKMGHVTALGATLAEAEQRARAAADAIRL
jgi:5-(carboxyamino)imidazole ribonucleotide synthase